MSQNNEVGSVVIKADLDTVGISAGSKKMENAITSAGDTVKKVSKEMSDSLSGYVKAIASAEQSAKEMASSMDSSGKYAQGLDEAANNARELDGAQEKLASSAESAASSLEDEYMALINAAKASSESDWENPTLMFDDIDDTIEEVERFTEAVDRLSEEEERYLELLKVGMSRPKSVDEEFKRAGLGVADGFDDAEEKVEATEEEIGRVTEMLREQSNATQSVQTGFKGVAETAKEVTNTEETETFGQKMEKTFRRVAASARHFFNLKPTFNPGEYQEQIDLISKTEDEVAALQARKEELAEAGVGEESERWTRLQSEIRMATQALAEQKEELKQMKAAGANNPIYDQWYQMGTISNTVVSGFRNIKNAGSAAIFAIQRPVQLLDRALFSLARNAVRTAISLGKLAGNAIVSALQNISARAKNAAQSLMQMAAKSISSGIQRIKGGIASLASQAGAAAKSLLNLGRSAKKSNGNIGASFKTVLKYVFGVRSMFFLVKRLRGAIVDALGNMAKIDKPTNKALSSMTSALNQVKNSLGTAFQPLVTAVAPYITQFLNLLSSAITKVAEFFALLTGQNYILQATAYQTDYAKSLDKTKSASKAATKEIKNQLAAFDQLNILSAPSDSGSNGGGGANADEIDPAKLFKRIPLTSLVSDFIRDLKAAFNSGDFFGVGTIIAGKLNEVFENVKKLISWDSVGDKITEFVTAVTSIFNGLTDPEKGINFGLIGETLGTGINTITRTLNTIFDKINWTNIRLALVNGLNGLFREINWDFIASLFAKRLNAITEVLEGLFNDVPWGQIAYELVHAFNEHITRGINWEALGNMLGGAASAVIDVLVTALSTFDWVAAADGISEALNHFILKVQRTIKQKQADINTIGDKIGDALNTMIQQIEWGHLGELLASYMGMPIAMLKRAIGRFEFGEAGTKFAQALNGFFSNTQMWEDVGDAINDGITGFLDFGKHFLEEFNETQVAADIKTALGKIKWGEIATKVWEDAKLLFRKTGSFLDVLLNDDSKSSWDIWDKRYIPTDDSLGKKIGDAIGKAISTIPWETLGGAISSAASSFFTNFTDAIKALAEKEENGKSKITNAIERFFGGINWGQVAQTLLEAATTLFITLGETLATLLWDAFKAIFVKSSAETFDEAATALEESGTEGLKTWAESSGKTVATGLFESMMSTMVDEKGKALPQYEAILEEIFGTDRPASLGNESAVWFYNSLIDALLNEQGKVKEEFRDALTAIMGEENVQALESGKRDMNAFFAGWQEAATSGEEKQKSALQKVFEAIVGKGVEENVLEEHSPSKRAKRMGEYYMQGFGQGIEGEQKETKSTVDSVFGDVIDIARHFSFMDAAVISGMLSIRESFTRSFKLINNDVTGYFTTMRTTTTTAMTALRVSITSSLNLITSSITTAVSTIDNRVRNGFNSINNSITNNLYSARSSAERINWAPVGDGIIDGIARGINNGWNWLNKTVWNLANALYRSARNALGIHSPSKLFADGVGKMIGLGIGEGLEDSEPQVLNAAMGVADAIADGMMIGETEMEMDVSGNGLLDGLNNVLTTFSGTVSTSFAELVAELNSIANSSSFRVPIVATGTILPYSVTGTATGDSTTVTQAIEASNDDLASVVMQAVNNATSAIVAAIQRSGTYGSTDKQSIDSIIDEINRRTLAQGKSPLLI